ncbi:hypothetical protein IFM89_026234 [Coptis chinensis]|uniref:Uncharacterized protein n=1 Tax=Coptis chinensis TaxID=261450 RepID=A0A835IFS1_9MAGN|nr:hypothetical protein IFM89_026234 [Coptis chinensis]
MGSRKKISSFNLEDKASKADYQPYGIDFPLGPSGQFSNGKNFIDALGELLKLPLIPAFKNPLTKGPLILHGVDYASGGSGILDETGSISEMETPVQNPGNHFLWLVWLTTITRKKVMATKTLGH